MKFEIPKSHILRSTLCIDIVQRILRWERQKRYFGGKKGKILLKLFWMIFLLFKSQREMKTRENKKIIKLKFFFKISLLEIF